MKHLKYFESNSDKSENLAAIEDALVNISDDYETNVHFINSNHYQVEITNIDLDLHIFPIKDFAIFDNQQKEISTLISKIREFISRINKGDIKFSIEYGHDSIIIYLKLNLDTIPMVEKDKYILRINEDKFIQWTKDLNLGLTLQSVENENHRTWGRGEKTALIFNFQETIRLEENEDGEFLFTENVSKFIESLKSVIDITGYDEQYGENSVVVYLSEDKDSKYMMQVSII